MSVIYCENCDKYIDLDYDAEHLDSHNICPTCKQENCDCDEQTMQLMDDELREEESRYEEDCE